MFKSAAVITFTFLALGFLLPAGPAPAASRCCAPVYHPQHLRAPCHGRHCRTHGYNEPCNCFREDMVDPSDLPEAKTRRSGTSHATLAVLSVHPGDRFLDPSDGSSLSGPARAKVFCLTRSYRI